MARASDQASPMTHSAWQAANAHSTPRTRLIPGKAKTDLSNIDCTKCSPRKRASCRKTAPAVLRQPCSKASTKSKRIFASSYPRCARCSSSRSSCSSSHSPSIGSRHSSCSSHSRSSSSIGYPSKSPISCGNCLCSSFR